MPRQINAKGSALIVALMLVALVAGIAYHLQLKITLLNEHTSRLIDTATPPH